jgi:putative DNA primase/helicase
MIGTQSGATESYLRQKLNSDARPISYDEAETKDQESSIRMKSVIRLARAASTFGADPIGKGGKDGTPSDWQINTMMIFSSISYCVTTPEDARRITPLGIIRDGNTDRYRKLVNMIGDTFTEEWTNRFVARSIKLIPTIRENTRIFGTSIAAHLADQGAGDQLGPLLAGAYSLYSNEVITAAEAAAWIKKQDWTEQRAISEDTDEHQCLAFLMQHIIRAQTKYGPIDRTVAELMDVANGKDQEKPENQREKVLSQDAAEEVLGRYGFRADPDGMVISVSHSGVATILRDTPWSRNWGRTLRRIPGSESTDGTVRFGATKSRGVEIPYADET